MVDQLNRSQDEHFPPQLNPQVLDKMNCKIGEKERQADRENSCSALISLLRGEVDEQVLFSLAE